LVYINHAFININKYNSIHHCVHIYTSFLTTSESVMGVRDRLKKAITGVKHVAKKVKYAGEVGKAGVDLARKIKNPANIAKFAANAARGEGFVLPGSKYIGPGNKMNKGAPVDEADANAYQHDIDYDNYLKKGHSKKDVYLGYSDADERLLKNTKANTASGLAVNLGMGAKKLLNKTGLTKRIRDTDTPTVSKAPPQARDSRERVRVRPAVGRRGVYNPVLQRGKGRAPVRPPSQQTKPLAVQPPPNLS
jgi:hypothetical protein